MRNRTKAPSAAIGVLVIIILLLRALSEGFPVIVVPTDSNDQSTVILRDLPFASKLANPCFSEVASPVQHALVSEEVRAAFIAEFYAIIRERASEYKQDAMNMLNNDVIPDCVTLNVPNFPNTPNLEDLEEMESGEALFNIYSSLMVHTAHAFFIQYQQVLHNETLPCDGDISDEKRLATNMGDFAVKQKYMACLIRMASPAMGHTQDYLNNNIMEERLTDLRSCSKRALRDCQLVHSSIYLLNVIESYAASRS